MQVRMCSEQMCVGMDRCAKPPPAVWFCWRREGTTACGAYLSYRIGGVGELGQLWRGAVSRKDHEGVLGRAGTGRGTHAHRQATRLASSELDGRAGCTQGGKGTRNQNAHRPEGLVLTPRPQ